MRKILSTITLFGCFSFSSFAQISNAAISNFKKKLYAETNDSSRLNLAIQLASGYRFSNVDSSLYYTDMALDYAVKLQLPDMRAGILSLKGATVLESGRLPESLQFQFEALDIAQKLKDNVLIAMAFNRIGNTYMELADYKKANEYYFRSKELFEVLRDSATICNEISNIGNIYELMNLPDSALYYQELVYKASELRYNDRNFITWPEVMFRLGNAYKLKGDNEKAMNYYKRGIIEANIDNDLRNLTANTLLLAKLYDDLKMPDSSLKYAYNALQTGKAVTFRKGVYDASLLISNLYKKRNQNDSAYKYLTIANQEKENLTGIKRFQELQRIILDEQERQKAAEAERIESQNRQKQFILLGGLGIFLIVASILYFNNRQKQKANKVLEATLTNLKSTQSQLIQSEKMASLGELTAGIAHEIQNPLNFVNNFSELNTELIDELQQEIKTGNTQEALSISTDIKDNQQKINHHGKRADAIVKGMLQHSRSNNGAKEPTDINALADEYLKLAYHGLRAKDKDFNAHLVTDFDASIGKINMVPQEIGRVVLNLITNAFYAVGEKKKMLGDGYQPTVTIASKRSGDKVLISVADTGNGIPKNVLDKIFQPFFTTKPTGQGTGLGLSLSYDIVKAHGGVLKVETEEGNGSIFIIQLPFKSSE